MDNVGFVGITDELGMVERVRNNNNNNNNYKASIEDGPGKKMTLNKPLEVSNGEIIIHARKMQIF